MRVCKYRPKMFVRNFFQHTYYTLGTSRHSKRMWLGQHSKWTSVTICMKVWLYPLFFFSNNHMFDKSPFSSKPHSLDEWNVDYTLMLFYALPVLRKRQGLIANGKRGDTVVAFVLGITALHSQHQRDMLVYMRKIW